MIKSHLGQVDHMAIRLEPLARGYAVSLSMYTDKTLRNKKLRRRMQLIALAPGLLYGLPSGSILVSVVGSGSCIVFPDQPGRISDLVLAGVPSKLAQVLMNALHHVFRSE